MTALIGILKAQDGSYKKITPHSAAQCNGNAISVEARNVPV